MSGDRLRVRFSKHGKIRFTSHRDVARIWERSLRRAQIPVAYTEGFSPRPKLSFGLALSTGYESRGEYLDVALREGDELIEPDEIARRVAPGLPIGLDVQVVARLEAGADSLQQTVTSCTWHLEIGDVGPDAVAAAIEAALAADALPLTRDRKGQTVTDDVRPAILTARVVEPANDGGSAVGTTVEAELATQPRALRPAELVGAIAPPEPAWTLVRVTRINQWTRAGGARREVIPLPPAATRAPHAEARAS
ncbi:MAG TPA: TIGR03936 family radical SAM-associated protein [Acidimicrobiales bacterium]|nr:TIGR03936 family radical SAM-associated protein [Acidimicrobiales bacterium]